MTLQNILQERNREDRCVQIEKLTEDYRKCMESETRLDLGLCPTSLIRSRIEPRWIRLFTYILRDVINTSCSRKKSDDYIDELLLNVLLTCDTERNLQPDLLRILIRLASSEYGVVRIRELLPNVIFILHTEAQCAAGKEVNLTSCMVNKSKFNTYLEKQSKAMRHWLESLRADPPNVDAKKRDRIKQFQELLHVLFRSHGTLFGSYTNSLATKHSDIDIVVELNAEIVKNLNNDKKLQRSITSAPNRIKNQDFAALLACRKLYWYLTTYDDIKTRIIESATVPIIRVTFDDQEEQLKLDVSFTRGDKAFGVANSELLKTYVECDSRTADLVILVKAWAEAHKLNSAFNGFLSSYAWTLLVVHFLQRRPVPVLPYLQERSKEQTVIFERPPFLEQKLSGDQYSKIRQTDHRGKNEETLAGLLYEFFRYYVYNFNYFQEVVSIRSPERLTKLHYLRLNSDLAHEFGVCVREEHLDRIAFFNIEDPMEKGVILRPTLEAQIQMSLHMYRAILLFEGLKPFIDILEPTMSTELNRVFNMALSQIKTIPQEPCYPEAVAYLELQGLKHTGVSDGTHADRPVHLFENGKLRLLSDVPRSRSRPCDINIKESDSQMRVYGNPSKDVSEPELPAEESESWTTSSNPDKPEPTILLRVPKYTTDYHIQYPSNEKQPPIEDIHTQPAASKQMNRNQSIKDSRCAEMEIRDSFDLNKTSDNVSHAVSGPHMDHVYNTYEHQWSTNMCHHHSNVDPFHMKRRVSSSKASQASLSAPQNILSEPRVHNYESIVQNIGSQDAHSSRERGLSSKGPGTFELNNHEQDKRWHMNDTIRVHPPSSQSHQFINHGDRQISTIVHMIKGLAACRKRYQELSNNLAQEGILQDLIELRNFSSLHPLEVDSRVHVRGTNEPPHIASMREQHLNAP